MLEVSTTTTKSSSSAVLASNNYPVPSAIDTEARTTG
jgi:hypothetical protein